MAESIPERVRSGERPLERHLLVEQHADHEGLEAGGEQLVGVGIAGDVEVDWHAETNVVSGRRA